MIFRPTGSFVSKYYFVQKDLFNMIFCFVKISRTFK